MNALFIFDQPETQIPKIMASLSRTDHVSWFCFSGEWKTLGEQLAIWRDAGYQITVLNAADLVAKEFTKLKETVPRWSSDLGSTHIRGKTIRDHFLNSRGDLSTWWFSSLSETNTLKTNVFLKIAQTHAVDSLLNSGAFDRFFIDIQDRELSRILRSLTEPHRPSPPETAKDLSSIVWHIPRAMVGLLKFIFRGMIAKFMMPSAQHAEVSRNLFITYFPYVKADPSEKFINRFTEPLQPKFAAWNVAPTWLLMFIPYDGTTFRQAIQKARYYARRGEKLYFHVQFLTPGGIARALTSYFRQVTIFLRLAIRAPDLFLSRNFTVAGAEPLLRTLWRDSFIGWTALEALLHYELFGEVIARGLGKERIVYFAEMHAWEKALNAARRARNSKSKSIAFQHAAIGEAELCYVQDRRDIEGDDSPSALPQPSVIAANGALTATFLKKQGYAQVVEVEAIRQLYLADVLSEEKSEHRARSVVIAGSLSISETWALMQLMFAAFPNEAPGKIIFKPHPTFPSEHLARLKPHLQTLGWEISNIPIDQLFRASTVAVVGSSSVSLDALACGCELIVPIFSNALSMSPLPLEHPACRLASNPDQMRRQVIDALNTPSHKLAAHRGIVSKYWNLDQNLAAWHELLA
jgi:surface carbohydrate biosynthesis protein (TIGR04326 family)